MNLKRVNSTQLVLLLMGIFADVHDFMTSAKVAATLDFHGSDLIIYEHPDNTKDHKLHSDSRYKGYCNDIGQMNRRD